MVTRKDIIKEILGDENKYSFSSRLEYALFLCLTPEQLGEIYYATRFFDIMIDSPRRSDRKRACDVQNLNWTTEREEKVWRKWLEYGQEECLVLLARFGNVDRVVEVFNEVWDSQKVSLKTKRVLLKYVAKSNYANIEFLQREYPVSYLYGRAIANKPLDTAKAVELALTATTTNELGFTLWCLGELQQWDAIIQILDKGAEIEQEFIDKIEQEFWEGQESLRQRGIKFSRDEQERNLMHYTRSRLYERY